jgi:oligosaccharyltransferase complex subunit epsilon
MSSDSISKTLLQGWNNYKNSTHKRIKLADLTVVSLLILTLVQFTYVIVSGHSFPVKSLVAGVFASGGSAVLTAALRMQFTNPKAFADIKPERAFAEFLVAEAVLFIGVFNYIG